jgi:hypothetical protein
LCVADARLASWLGCFVVRLLGRCPSSAAPVTASLTLCAPCGAALAGCCVSSPRPSASPCSTAARLRCAPLRSQSGRGAPARVRCLLYGRRAFLPRPLWPLVPAFGGGLSGAAQTAVVRADTRRCPRAFMRRRVVRAVRRSRRRCFRRWPSLPERWWCGRGCLGRMSAHDWGARACGLVGRVRATGHGRGLHLRVFRLRDVACTPPRSPPDGARGCGFGRLLPVPTHTSHQRPLHFVYPLM